MIDSLPVRSSGLKLSVLLFLIPPLFAVETVVLLFWRTPPFVIRKVYAAGFLSSNRMDLPFSAFPLSVEYGVGS